MQLQLPSNILKKTTTIGALIFHLITQKTLKNPKCLIRTYKYASRTLCFAVYDALRSTPP